MQPEILRRFAPNSLYLMYNAADTGSPNHDLNTHLERFANTRVNVANIDVGQRREARAHPIFTGNAGRIDLEETQLVGGRVIGHIEQDLGPADEAELQYRILTIPYAETKLDSNPNAVEFVRVIKECAGDTDPRSLQIWASWAYGEIRTGLDSYSEASGLSRDEHKTQIVTEVLTKLGRMAMELTAVTATKEERLVEEPETYLYFGPQHCYTDGADEKERKSLFDNRCREILDRQDTTDPFTAELRSITDKMSRSHASSNPQSEIDIYESHLRSEGVKDEDLGAIIEDFERVTEQYTEDGATSLHMSDGERFIVDGTLEEDIDGTYLPPNVQGILPELLDLFTSGTRISSDDETEYTIATFIERQLDLVYGNRSDREARIIRTVRSIAYLPEEAKTLLPQLREILTSTGNLNTARQFIQRQLQILFTNSTVGNTTSSAERQTTSDTTGTARVRQSVSKARAGLERPPADSFAAIRSTLNRMLPAIAADAFCIDNAGLVEFKETTSVYSNAEERRYVEEVLNQIVQNMSRDFILKNLNRSRTFRAFFQTIQTATDTRALISCAQAAYKARQKGTLTIKLFTALSTIYRVKRAELESAPLRSTDDAGRQHIVATALLQMAETIPTRELRTLSTAIHTLPLQEQERIRQTLKRNRQSLYERIRTGLAEIINAASARKLMYLRFAFYEDRSTGVPNEPHNMIHLLAEPDRAELWQLLKSKSRMPEPMKA